jgi:hypothetical protein
MYVDVDDNSYREKGRSEWAWIPCRQIAIVPGTVFLVNILWACTVIINDSFDVESMPIH